MKSHAAVRKICIRFIIYLPYPNNNKSFLYAIVYCCYTNICDTKTICFVFGAGRQPATIVIRWYIDISCRDLCSGHKQIVMCLSCYVSEMCLYSCEILCEYILNHFINNAIVWWYMIINMQSLLSLVLSVYNLHD